MLGVFTASGTNLTKVIVVKRTQCHCISYRGPYVLFTNLSFTKRFRLNLDYDR